jgi:phage shock protein A|tara:strand:+ start:2548 stop:3219 length:672 start_codon:yes stop_codon:yes gene_type:complete
MGQAEAHSVIDKLEDPIKLTEQGIRDMKKDLDKSLQALAEVKAMEIRSRGDIKKHQEAAKDYEGKAMLILKKAQSGSITPEEADRLASEALRRKDENLEALERVKSELQKFESSTSQLDQNVKKLRSTVSKWENELKTLKARVKVSTATAKLNKQLSQIDSSGTVSMLEKMKEKVAQEEALAESYGEIANESKSIDEEIDNVLADEASSSSLDELKKKMGLDN